MELKSLRNSVRLGSTTVLEIFDGEPPLSIEVLSGGAGGVITSKGDSTYYYTAPFLVADDKRINYDIIRATDGNGATSEIKLSVYTMEMVVAEVIQKSLGLSDGQVLIGNQDFVNPNDERVYFAVIIGDGKVFANTSKKFEKDGELYESKSVSLREMLTIQMMSASNAVLRYRHKLLMELAGDYCIKSQEAFSYKIGKIPINFTNTSQITGPTIPYSFDITIPIIYSVGDVVNISSFNNFEENDIILN